MSVLSSATNTFPQSLLSLPVVSLRLVQEMLQSGLLSVGAQATFFWLLHWLSEVVDFLLGFVGVTSDERLLCKHFKMNSTENNLERARRQ